MSFGHELLVFGDGIRISPAMLEPFGIRNNSVCWGVWLHDPRYAPKPKKGRKDDAQTAGSGGTASSQDPTQAPASKGSTDDDEETSNSEGTTFSHPVEPTPHLFLSPIHPRSWPISARLVVSLSQARGTLHAASEVLTELGVEILSSNSFKTGHYHATWSLVAECTRRRYAYRAERERLDEARKCAGWGKCGNWQRFLRYGAKRDIIKNKLEKYFWSWQAERPEFPPRDIDRAVEAVVMANELRNQMAFDTIAFIKLMKISLLAAHLKRMKDTKQEILHGVLMDQDSLFWNIDPNDMTNKAKRNPRCRVGEPNSEVRPTPSIYSINECEGGSSGGSCEGSRGVYKMIDKKVEEITEALKGYDKTGYIAKWLDHQKTTLWDYPAKYQFPVILGDGLSHLGHAWLFGDDVLTPMKFRYCERDAILRIENRREAYDGVIRDVIGAHRRPVKVPASFQPEDGCIRVCFNETGALTHRIRVDLQYVTEATPALADQTSRQRREYQHHSIGLLSAITEKLSNSGIDLIHSANSLTDRRRLADEGTVELRGLFDMKKHSVNKSLTDHLQDLRRNLEAVVVGPENGDFATRVTKVRVMEERLDKVFISARIDLFRHKVNLREHINKVAYHFGFEPIIMDQPIVRITDKVNEAISNAKALLQIIPLLPGPDGKIEKLDALKLDWLLFEYGLAYRDGLPTAICVDTINGISVSEWQKRLQIMPDRTMFPFNSISDSPTIARDVGAGMKWLRNYIDGIA